MSLQQPVPSAPSTDNGWRPRGSEARDVRAGSPQPPAAPSVAGVPAAERLPRPPRRRNTGLAALAVLLVVGGAAVAGLLALRIDERVDVVVAGQDIPAGTVVTQEMLARAPVAAQGVDLVPASDVQSVVGRYAAVPIGRGQIVARAMLTGASVLRPGTVALGVALDPGQLPAEGLAQGDRVAVYGTEGDGVVLAADAVVLEVKDPQKSTFGGTGDPTVVTLVVATDAAARIAAANGAGKISLGLVARGGAAGAAPAGAAG